MRHDVKFVQNFCCRTSTTETGR